MKKYKLVICVICGIIVLCILLSASYIHESRFGYFKTGINLNYSHPNADVFLIKNNKVLILGNSFNNIITEICDINNKTIEKQEFNKYLQHTEEGLLIDNNKLFLLRTCINGECGKSVIYDLDKNSIDHIYDNTFAVSYNNKLGFLQDYLLLTNNDVFYITYKFKTKESEIGIIRTKTKDKSSLKTNENLCNAKAIQIDDKKILIMTINKAFIYDVENNKLDYLEFPYGKLANPFNNVQHVTHLIKCKDRIIIFMFLADKNFNYYNINLSFNVNNNKFSKLSASNIIRDYKNNNEKYISNVIKLNNKYILISGGLKNSGLFSSLLQAHYIMQNTAEIYDIEKDKFYKINSMPFAKFGHRAIKLNNGNILIIGGQTSKVFWSFNCSESKKNINFIRKREN